MKTNLRKWQQAKLREVLRTVEKTASIHHSDEEWNEADFNLWAESWVIPQIKKVLGENKKNGNKKQIQKQRDWRN